MDKGWCVVLVGGLFIFECMMVDVVFVVCWYVLLDFIGKDMFKCVLVMFVCMYFLFMFDFGFMYMVNVVGIKVFGLYVVSNLDCFGFYFDCCWCVNCYDDVVCQFFGKFVSVLVWGVKIEKFGVMDLIMVDDVVECFEVFVIDCGF